jgi:hypothetical protein
MVTECPDMLAGKTMVINQKLELIEKQRSEKAKRGSAIVSPKFDPSQAGGVSAIKGLGFRVLGFTEALRRSDWLFINYID